MAVVNDLDIVSDRSARIAKIIREAAKANITTNPGDPDLDVPISAGQKQALRDRIDPLVVDLRAAWARLPAIF